MPTNKIVLRTVEEVMEDYQPVYKPLYSLFLNGSQEYDAEAGVQNFRRVEAVGDIRAKRLTPKDTELKLVSATGSTKQYKKYFLANKFVTSGLQSTEGNGQVVDQVLDEHQAQADELLLFGDGTANNNVINNGLFYSADINFTEKSSAAIASGDTRLALLHSAILGTLEQARNLDGTKIILVYGEQLIPYMNTLFPTVARPLSSVLQDSLEAGETIVKMPAYVTPAGVNGWEVINLDRIKLHHSVLPSLDSQGYNEEDMYYWHNFLMGSMMVDVLAKDAIIKQPITFS